MQDKSNISLIISGLALAISLYALFGNKNENRFVKSNDKVYIPADPKAKNGIQEFKNQLENSPLTDPNINLDKTPKTTVAFSNDSHDFGNIEQDTENKYSFTFINTGLEPLIIKNARGSCGCTVPNYPKDPIMPGKAGQIDVVYKPAKQKGNQTKTVTVSANTDPENTILKISANVNEPG